MNSKSNDFEEFNRYCQQCKDRGICVKDPKTVNICQQLIDKGVWDIVFRTGQGKGVVDCPKDENYWDHIELERRLGN